MDIMYVWHIYVAINALQTSYVLCNASLDTSNTRSTVKSHQYNTIL